MCKHQTLITTKHSAQQEASAAPYLDRSSGVENFLTTDKAVSGLHSYSPHCILSQVLCHLQHNPQRVVLHLQSRENRRKALVEFNIYHSSNDCGDLADTSSPGEISRSVISGKSMSHHNCWIQATTTAIEKRSIEKTSGGGIQHISGGASTSTYGSITTTPEAFGLLLLGSSPPCSSSSSSCSSPGAQNCSSKSPSPRHRSIAALVWRSWWGSQSTALDPTLWRLLADADLVGCRGDGIVAVDDDRCRRASGRCWQRFSGSQL